MPFLCPSPPDQDGSVKRWAGMGSLEDSVPFRYPSLPDQVVGTESWAEPSRLEDSCSSYAMACPTKMEA
jgi:hypothetical protein